LAQYILIILKRVSSNHETGAGHLYFLLLPHLQVTLTFKDDIFTAGPKNGYLLLCRATNGLTLANLAKIHKNLLSVVNGTNIPNMVRKVVILRPEIIVVNNVVILLWN
jgi:hypothetical protein